MEDQYLHYLLSSKFLFEDVALEIINGLPHSKEAKIEILEAFKLQAYSRILEHDFYTNGTEEENSINQGLCLLVQMLNGLTLFREKFSSLKNVFNYLDPQLTKNINIKSAVKEVKVFYMENRSLVNEIKQTLNIK
ncbi:hypothetical protein [Burkholderia sp. 9779_493]|uniref:hypothetical protein n=1 Tax=Burkholderia sp. 9779_493 TaxID=2751184 RepID=UPI0018C36E8D|nr:hypothetical protein [Burkholderia sp. 9779_493]MBG0863707.1 hypothetical protein [Burkholderia sp. 9779_493]